MSDTSLGLAILEIAGDSGSPVASLPDPVDNTSGVVSPKIPGGGESAYRDWHILFHSALLQTITEIQLWIYAAGRWSKAGDPYNDGAGLEIPAGKAARITGRDIAIGERLAITATITEPLWVEGLPLEVGST